MHTRLLTIALITSSLMGCHNMSSSDSRESLFDSWTLTQSDSLSNIPDNILLTLVDNSEKGTQVSGFSGVNRVTGSAKLGADQNFSFGPLASTRMMGPEPRMTFESQYLKTLQSVKSYQLEGDQLTLTTKDGQKLVFKRGVR